MNNDILAQKVFDKMWEKDKFSQWLGIKALEVKQGKCVLEMIVRNEMLNGFEIIHGGVTFAFADSAFAFASNSYGRISVSIDTVMSYPASAKEGDVLKATAELQSLTNKTAIFDVTIVNQDNIKIGLFRGTVYRTSKEFFPKEEEIQK